MDYKQKYETALETLKRIKEANIDNQELVEFIESKYPELRENETEDERIKKTLIRFFSRAAECDSSTYGIKDRNIIAWLEKQGEPEIVVVVPKFRVGDTIRPKKGFMTEYTIESISGECYHGKGGWGIPICCDDDYELVEKKHTDKVESKFKLGNWIVYCNEDVDLITGIEDKGYIINKGGYIPFTCEGDMRLWTIQDAKDGDVLTVHDNVFIYAHRKQLYSIAVAHCFVNSVGDFCFDGEFGYTERGNSIHPATKEQRDLLFCKMKEAGYEWDAEKKEIMTVVVN